MLIYTESSIKKFPLVLTGLKYYINIITNTSSKREEDDDMNKEDKLKALDAAIAQIERQHGEVRRFR